MWNLMLPFSWYDVHGCLLLEWSTGSLPCRVGWNVVALLLLLLLLCMVASCRLKSFRDFNSKSCIVIAVVLRRLRCSAPCALAGMECYWPTLVYHRDLAWAE